MINFEYHITRSSRRKTASISVTPDNYVEVVVPDTLSDAKVLDLVDRKSRWINNKILINKEIHEKSNPKQYVSGESFAYLGKNYRLKIVYGESNVIKLLHGKFIVTIIKNQPDHQQVIRRLLSQWYQSHALQRLTEKTIRYADKIGVTPSSIGVKDYKSRWGSCTSSGNIFYNWHIITASHLIIDYVVVHELCHLVHKDHSKRFWRQVGRVMPDYMECKKWLKVHGHQVLHQ